MTMGTVTASRPHRHPERTPQAESSDLTPRPRVALPLADTASLRNEYFVSNCPPTSIRAHLEQEISRQARNDGMGPRRYFGTPSWVRIQETVSVRTRSMEELFDELRQVEPVSAGIEAPSPVSSVVSSSNQRSPSARMPSVPTSSVARASSPASAAISTAGPGGQVNVLPAGIVTRPS